MIQVLRSFRCGIDRLTLCAWTPHPAVDFATAESASGGVRTVSCCHGFQPAEWACMVSKTAWAHMASTVSQFRWKR